MSQSNNEVFIKQRKKTGPSPKYGPDQAKKMVSMRLSPDALNSIKRAAEVVFKDSQADVVEKMTRFFPPEALQKICSLAQEYNEDPAIVLKDALELYKIAKAKTPAVV